LNQWWSPMVQWMLAEELALLQNQQQLEQQEMYLL
jgi:hypothetical protein